MKCIIDGDKMVRTIRRISHEIIERNTELENVVFLGIETKGYPIAKMINKNISSFENIDIPVYPLDITGYRDDMNVSDFSKLDINLKDKVVIVVDDVLFTGRTVRASMDAVMDLGRPKKIQLAVLVDRGHRELPIRADYVGKNIPTSFDESVIVNTADIPGVYLEKK